MQIILNVAGNAIKFTKEGHISITASIARTDYLRDFRTADFYPVACDGHFYLKVQVIDYKKADIFIILSPVRYVIHIK